MTSSGLTVTASTSSSSQPQVTLMGSTNINQPPSLIAINSTQVPIKLSKGGNYAAWRSQFENLFFGYGLMGYLDGTTPCPPAAISTTTDTSGQESDRTTANPDYQLWLRQDRLLLHAIQVSCMGAAQSIVTRSTTSAQAWDKLEVAYANRSNTRKLGLLDSLTNVSLEDKSIADYMQGIKSILDNLELIGHPVDDGAIVIHTLNGLGAAYTSLASAIRARDTPISFEELYDKLLDHEAFLRRDETKKNSAQIAAPITAQFTQRNFTRRGRGSHSNALNYSGHHQHGNFNSQPHQQPNSGNFGNYYTGGSRGTHPQFGNSHRPQHHFNSTSPQQWRPPTTPSNSRPVCQLCDKVGHTARTCRSRPPPSLQSWPQANNMTTDQFGSRDNNWILDSGASHHMTSDLQNLSLHSEYGGPENIMLGDGSNHGGILGPRPE